jgi:hypothetical protein
MKPLRNEKGFVLQFRQRVKSLVRLTPALRRGKQKNLAMGRRLRRLIHAGTICFPGY